MRFVAALFGVFLSCAISASAQQQLRVPLDPGRISPLSDVILTENGDYLLGSGIIPANPLAGANLNVTRLNTRAGIVWSKDYLLQGGINRTRIAEWPAENALLFSSVTVDSTQSKVVIKTEPDGSIIWSRQFGADKADYSVNLDQSEVWPEDDGTALLAAGASVLASNDDPNDLFLARINADGQLIWSKKICFSCLQGADASFSDLIKTRDGNYVLSGTYESPSAGVPAQTVLLIKFDGNGNLIWVRNYAPSNLFVLPDVVAHHLAERPNGNLVTTGYVESFAPDFKKGLVLETDRNGQLLKVQTIELINTNQEVEIIQSIPAGNSQLAISVVTRLDTINPASIELNILAQIDADNSVVWQHNYLTEPTVGYITNTGGFISQPAGGYAYFPNFAQFLDNLFPYFILVDENGKNGCEEPVGMSISEESNFVGNNLSPTVQDRNLQDDFDVTETDFNPLFNFPLLDLGPDTSLCTTQPFPLDATIPGSDVTYLWNTGDTTATILADSAAVYRVTVTDPVQCLRLIDSIRVGIASTPPSLDIVLDTTNFCTDSTLRLIAITVADSVRWSNGETNDTITITEAGLYRVTAYNACGFSEDTLTVFLPRCQNICPFLFPNAFTPNDDGTNDLFRPVGECPEVESFRFQVYNRWGDLVFEGLEPTDGWDGEVNGQPAPTDVYVWWARYRLPDQEEILEKGDVTLLR
ncbi:MAG: gliding motility-associated C-terminal domain-containing protein [Saprospiraceae bacterium]|nr:gliding motility-associated C-terminal domain-containing protein [Saprospiraceae bacterium]